MKKLLIVLFAFTLSQVEATTEHDPVFTSEPSAQEVSMNRACFEELKTLGCGDPGEEVGHFRACLKDVFPTLTPHCKELMSFLYTQR